MQVYGYASGKLPNIFPDSVTEAYGIQAGDDAVACVSDGSICYRIFNNFILTDFYPTSSHFFAY